MTANEPAVASGRRYASGLSRHPDPAVAVAEVIGQVTDGLGANPSVAVLFAAGSSIDALDDVIDAVQTLLLPELLIGTTSIGVLAGAEELEDGDGLAVWAATGIDATSFRLESFPGSPPLVLGLPDTLLEGSTVVALADPYTFPVEALVERLNEDHPGVHLAGGLASADRPERNRVVLDGTVNLEGAVGFVLPPGVATPIVSQGCRPIGSPWVITQAEGQLVRELGGRPALERLSELIESLSDVDRSAATNGLHAGMVADEQQAEFDQGDFLIRGVLGADRATGAVAIGDRPEVGQVLQFQVRDEASASKELDRLLRPAEGRSALVFTCNGRGSHLFSTPSHDAAKVAGKFGPAVAGMFCAGELGPIADRNAVHAFTATVLAFH